MPGLHQLLLNNVLNLLDVNKRLASIFHSIGHSLGHVDGRRAVFFLREKRFPNRNLDFVLVPTDDLIGSADQADADFFI